MNSNSWFHHSCSFASLCPYEGVICIPICSVRLACLTILLKEFMCATITQHQLGIALCSSIGFARQWVHRRRLDVHEATEEMHKIGRYPQKPIMGGKHVTPAYMSQKCKKLLMAVRQLIAALQRLFLPWKNIEQRTTASRATFVILLILLLLQLLGLQNGDFIQWLPSNTVSAGDILLSVVIQLASILAGNTDTLFHVQMPIYLIVYCSTILISASIAQYSRAKLIHKSIFWLFHSLHFCVVVLTVIPFGMVCAKIVSLTYSKSQLVSVFVNIGVCLFAAVKIALNSLFLLRFSIVYQTASSPIVLTNTRAFSMFLFFLGTHSFLYGIFSQLRVFTNIIMPIVMVTYLSAARFCLSFSSQLQFSLVCVFGYSVLFFFAVGVHNIFYLIGISLASAFLVWFFMMASEYRRLEHVIRSASFMRAMEGGIFLGKGLVPIIFGLMFKLSTNVNFFNGLPMYVFDGHRVRVSLSDLKMNSTFTLFSIAYSPAYIVVYYATYYPFLLFRKVLTVLGITQKVVVFKNCNEARYEISKCPPLYLHERYTEPSGLLALFSENNKMIRYLLGRRSFGCDHCVDRLCLRILVRHLLARIAAVEEALLGVVFAMLMSVSKTNDDHFVIATLSLLEEFSKDIRSKRNVPTYDLLAQIASSATAPTDSTDVTLKLEATFQTLTDEFLAIISRSRRAFVCIEPSSYLGNRRLKQRAIERVRKLTGIFSGMDVHDYGHFLYTLMTALGTYKGHELIESSEIRLLHEMALFTFASPWVPIYTKFVLDGSTNVYEYFKAVFADLFRFVDLSKFSLWTLYSQTRKGNIFKDLIFSFSPVRRPENINIGSQYEENVEAMRKQCSVLSVYPPTSFLAQEGGTLLNVGTYNAPTAPHDVENILEHLAGFGCVESKSKQPTNSFAQLFTGDTGLVSRQFNQSVPGSANVVDNSADGIIHPVGSISRMLAPSTELFAVPIPENSVPSAHPLDGSEDSHKSSDFTSDSMQRNLNDTAILASDESSCNSALLQASFIVHARAFKYRPIQMNRHIRARLRDLVIIPAEYERQMYSELSAIKRSRYMSPRTGNPLNRKFPTYKLDNETNTMKLKACSSIYFDIPCCAKVQRLLNYYLEAGELLGNRGKFVQKFQALCSTITRHTKGFNLYRYTKVLLRRVRSSLCKSNRGSNSTPGQEHNSSTLTKNSSGLFGLQLNAFTHETPILPLLKKVSDGRSTGVTDNPLMLRHKNKSHNGCFKHSSGGRCMRADSRKCLLAEFRSFKRQYLQSTRLHSASYKKSKNAHLYNHLRHSSSRAHRGTSSNTISPSNARKPLVKPDSNTKPSEEQEAKKVVMSSFDTAVFDQTLLEKKDHGPDAVAPTKITISGISDDIFSLYTLANVTDIISAVLFIDSTNQMSRSDFVAQYEHSFVTFASHLIGFWAMLCAIHPMSYEYGEYPSLFVSNKLPNLSVFNGFALLYSSFKKVDELFRRESSKVTRNSDTLVNYLSFLENFNFDVHRTAIVRSVCTYFAREDTALLGHNLYSLQNKGMLRSAKHYASNMFDGMGIAVDDRSSYLSVPLSFVSRSDMFFKDQPVDDAVQPTDRASFEQQSLARYNQRMMHWFAAAEKAKPASVVGENTSLSDEHKKPFIGGQPDFHRGLFRYSILRLRSFITVLITCLIILFACLSLSTLYTKYIFKVFIGPVLFVHNYIVSSVTIMESLILRYSMTSENVSTLRHRLSDVLRGSFRSLNSASCIGIDWPCSYINNLNKQLDIESIRDSFVNTTSLGVPTFLLRDAFIDTSTFEPRMFFHGFVVSGNDISPPVVSPSPLKLSSFIDLYSLYLSQETCWPSDYLSVDKLSNSRTGIVYTSFLDNNMQVLVNSLFDNLISLRATLLETALSPWCIAYVVIYLIFSCTLLIALRHIQFHIVWREFVSFLTGFNNITGKELWRMTCVLMDIVVFSLKRSVSYIKDWAVHDQPTNSYQSSLADAYHDSIAQASVNMDGGADPGAEAPQAPGTDAETSTIARGPKDQSSLQSKLDSVSALEIENDCLSIISAFDRDEFEPTTLQLLYTRIPLFAIFLSYDMRYDALKWKIFQCRRYLFYLLGGDINKLQEAIVDRSDNESDDECDFPNGTTNDRTALLNSASSCDTSFLDETLSGDNLPYGNSQPLTQLSSYSPDSRGEEPNLSSNNPTILDGNLSISRSFGTADLLATSKFSHKMQLLKVLLIKSRTRSRLIAYKGLVRSIGTERSMKCEIPLFVLLSFTLFSGIMIVFGSTSLVSLLFKQLLAVDMKQTDTMRAILSTSYAIDDDVLNIMAGGLVVNSMCNVQQRRAFFDQSYLSTHLTHLSDEQYSYSMQSDSMAMGQSLWSSLNIFIAPATYLVMAAFTVLVFPVRILFSFLSNSSLFNYNMSPWYLFDFQSVLTFIARMGKNPDLDAKCDYSNAAMQSVLCLQQARHTLDVANTIIFLNEAYNNHLPESLSFYNYNFEAERGLFPVEQLYVENVEFFNDDTCNTTDYPYNKDTCGYNGTLYTTPVLDFIRLNNTESGNESFMHAARCMIKNNGFLALVTKLQSLVLWYAKGLNDGIKEPTSYMKMQNSISYILHDGFTGNIMHDIASLRLTTTLVIIMHVFLSPLVIIPLILCIYWRVYNVVVYPRHQNAATLSTKRLKRLFDVFSIVTIVLLCILYVLTVTQALITHAKADIVQHSAEVYKSVARLIQFHTPYLFHTTKLLIRGSRDDLFTSVQVHGISLKLYYRFALQLYPSEISYNFSALEEFADRINDTRITGNTENQLLATVPVADVFDIGLGLQTFIEREHELGRSAKKVDNNYFSDTGIYAVNSNVKLFKDAYDSYGRALSTFLIAADILAQNTTNQQSIEMFMATKGILEKEFVTYFDRFQSILSDHERRFNTLDNSMATTEIFFFALIFFFLLVTGAVIVLPTLLLYFYHIKGLMLGVSCSHALSQVELSNQLQDRGRRILQRVLNVGAGEGNQSSDTSSRVGQFAAAYAESDGVEAVRQALSYRVQSLKETSISQRAVRPTDTTRNTLLDNSLFEVQDIETNPIFSNPYGSWSSSLMSRDITQKDFTFRHIMGNMLIGFILCATGIAIIFLLNCVMVFLGFSMNFLLHVLTLPLFIQRMSLVLQNEIFNNNIVDEPLFTPTTLSLRMISNSSVMNTLDDDRYDCSVSVIENYLVCSGISIYPANKITNNIKQSVDKKRDARNWRTIDHIINAMILYLTKAIFGSRQNAFHHTAENNPLWNTLARTAHSRMFLNADTSQLYLGFRPKTVKAICADVLLPETVYAQVTENLYKWGFAKRFDINRKIVVTRDAVSKNMLLQDDYTYILETVNSFLRKFEITLPFINHNAAQLTLDLTQDKSFEAPLGVILGMVYQLKANHNKEITNRSLISHMLVALLNLFMTEFAQMVTKEYIAFCLGFLLVAAAIIIGITVLMLILLWSPGGGSYQLQVLSFSRNMLLHCQRFLSSGQSVV